MKGKIISETVIVAWVEWKDGRPVSINRRYEVITEEPFEEGTEK